MKTLLINGFGEFPLTPDVFEKRGQAGLFLYYFKIIKELAKRGHKVFHILAYSKSSETFCSLESQKEANGVYRIQYGTNLPLNKEIENIIQSADIAINIENWDNRYMHLTSSNCKLIYWSHCATISFRNYDRYNKILVSSGWHKRALMARQGVTENKTLEINPGIDHFVCPEIKKDQYKLIYFTNPTNGLIYLPYIYKKLLNINSKYNLTIISNLNLYSNRFVESDEIRLLKEQIKNMPNTRILNNLPRHELLKEIASSKVYIYPDNHKETFGFSIFEALRCGTFCVIPNVGNIEDFNISGLIKIDTNESLRNPKILQVNLDNNILDKMVEQVNFICSNNSQLSVNNDYGLTWEKCGLNWETGLNSLL